jgi:hypothetical protein
VTSLSNADFNTIIYDEKINSKKGQKYTSIIIGKNIPNTILNDFFTALYQFKDEFTYIRLNEDDTKSSNIFIGASSKRSQERKDTLLNAKIWTSLKSPNSNIIQLIQRLEGTASK